MNNDSNNDNQNSNPIVSALRTQIRDILMEEIKKLGLIESTNHLSSNQSTEVRALVVAELAAQLGINTGTLTAVGTHASTPASIQNAPNEASINHAGTVAGKGRRGPRKGQPPSMTPTAIYQRERREKRLREQAAASSQAENSMVSAVDAVAAVVEQAMQEPVLIVQEQNTIENMIEVQVPTFVADAPKNGGMDKSAVSTQVQEQDLSGLRI